MPEYRAGGAGPDAFDCSGLVKWSYKQAGVSLKHGTANQIKQVKRITKKELMPGDLSLFWSRQRRNSTCFAVYR
jgi:peptidoglycan DL-endopeptidase CwlO